MLHFELNLFFEGGNVGNLTDLIANVNATHPDLGNAVAFATIATKAKKCLLVVAPAGCGKSATGDAVGAAHPEAIRLDSVTRSGLRDFKDVFTHFQGLVVVDDLGKVDTNYSRIHTVTSFAELCYSHFISKHTMTVTVEIAEFFGSCIMNVQPPVLGMLVKADEWEVVTQDKTIRYYHLFRPTTPNENKPAPFIDWGIDLSLVKKPSREYKLWAKLEAIASIQWSDARCLEHLQDLLRATAALERRETVLNEDYILLHRLMRPMIIEKYIKSKYGFETGRSVSTNLLAVLVEFATWNPVTIDRICRDYKVSSATAYRLLSEIKEWFEPSETKSKRLVPKPELKRILKEVGGDRC